MTIERHNHGRNHSYTIDGVKVPGATTLIKTALATPALINWAGNTTAEFAVDHWAELAKVKPTDRLERLKACRWEERDAAGGKGTAIHALGERLVIGEEVEVPDELAGHVEAYVDFLNVWNPEPILVETVIANRTVGYCGTIDLLARMAGEAVAPRHQDERLRDIRLGRLSNRRRLRPCRGLPRRRAG